MPPKKKSALGPIVVGTVSTRSTRRQSVVNIEIPKTIKPTSKNPAKANKNVANQMDVSKTAKQAATNKVAFQSFTERIQASYANAIHKNYDNEHSSPNKPIITSKPNVTKVLGQKSTNFDLMSSKQSNTAVKKIVNVIQTTDLNSVLNQEVSRSPMARGKSKVKSNKALLQILEDWTDDDSQDEKNDSSETETSDDAKNESVENITKLVRLDSSLTNKEYESNKEKINYESSPQMKSKYLEDIMQTVVCPVLPKENNQFSSEQKLKQMTDSSNFVPEQNEGLNSLVSEITREYLVEKTQNELTAETTFEDEGTLIECLTEEVVSGETELFLMEKNSHLLEDHRKPEKIKKHFTPPSHSQKENDVDITEEKLRESVILEETSQSISTSDSNDAEVRGFFAKEIEKNEISNEGNISNMECELTEEVSSLNTVSNIDYSVSLFEDNFIETEITTEPGSTISDEGTPELEHHYAELEEIGTTEMDILEDQTGTAVTKRQKFEERMDTTDDHSEESLEHKVANLHLKDLHLNIEKKDDTRKSGKMYLQDIKSLEDLLSEKIDLKGDVEDEIKEENLLNQNEVDLEYGSSENANKHCLYEKTEIRTTRSSDAKLLNFGLAPIEQQKEPMSVKHLKPAKGQKEKEKKSTKPKEFKLKDDKLPKEMKSKKKILSALVVKKGKGEKKLVLQSEKKESFKKNVKQDNDQTKKSSKLDNGDSEDTEVRRSSRIKSISVLKKKTTGHGLVRSKSEPMLNESDISDSNSTQTESEKSTPSASPKILGKDRKTRWTRSSENLSSDSQSTTDSVQNKSECQPSHLMPINMEEKPKIPSKDPVIKARLKQFVHLKENSYKTDRMTCKEAKKMTCDCFLTDEEREANEYGCGEDCLNRLLLIECGNLCQVGDRCTNKRFQKGQFAPVEVFNADKKGLGLRAAANIPYGEFILEYVGEVLNPDEFDKRAEVYSQDKNIHYYFMSLRADAIIDATMKGNISRFINHSCDPNAETQKWTVNGELRIGFFSTRTILAGEEVTFDYRFQRYGKEAQKCYCGAATCRGWLGERPIEDSEDEDEEEEEEEEEAPEVTLKEKIEPPLEEAVELLKKVEIEEKSMIVAEAVKTEETKVDETPTLTQPTTVVIKRKVSRKKPRKEFEELDQLDEDIEMLVTTGLKNQAHTLKLSRLMVRAKEPVQRAKLLRILRRGELPCRRLFLDYHGLRLMHGYMIDAQHLVHTDKKYESVRLEILQTLAVLPIPNKTMLQDSKVLPTVEKWSTSKDLGSPLDSDSNSPRNEQDGMQTAIEESNKIKIKEELLDDKSVLPKKDILKPERSIEDQEEEIRFLATKLLEEWANLKEVFRIPKKERIEQMKEHEREANKKFMQSNEQESSRKSDRYRTMSRYKLDREANRKASKTGEKPSAEFIRLSKIERRKLFALQHELKEEERRLKQRELWRQHELNCLLIGTDPRFTAPFDPSRGYQCIWNPQIGQWQNYPLTPQNQSVFSSQPSTSSTMVFSSQPPTPNNLAFPSQPPTPSGISVPSMPNLSVPPPQLPIPKSISNFPFAPQLGISTSLNGNMSQLSTSISLTGHVPPQAVSTVPQMHLQQQMHNPQQNIPQMTSMQGLTSGLLSNVPPHAMMTGSNVVPMPPLPSSFHEKVKIEEEFSQTKFLGPIPPPAKLPPKWKCAKDKYGRPYYYHIKIRKSQWEPPPFLEPPEEQEESSETESSSDTSSLSSDSSSDNSESEDDIDDAKLLLEVRKQMEKSAKLTLKTVIPDYIKTEENATPSPDEKISEEFEIDNDEDTAMNSTFADEEARPSIDIRLKEQFDLLKDDKPPKKKRRVGLCEEIIISPRTEEDRLQFKEDLKKYKANKEKLKRQKELILQQTKKQLREADPKKQKEKRLRATLKTRIKEMPDFNSEAAKKIKENFRSNMASTVVGSLNNYRKPDCKEGRITNTEDFKHLARKLTHFVMLKEMKHIAKIEDLTCTDNVKSKAREYIRKYMSKFGEVYIKRNDSPDFKD